MKAKKYTKETIKNIGIVDRKFPSFTIGDAIEVVQKIKEGDKSRLQKFEGDVIAINNSGISSTFTVRHVGVVSVEKIFPYYSPLIDSINFLRPGKVRRAKLYYMRGRVGKAARVKARRVTQQSAHEQSATVQE